MRGTFGLYQNLTLPVLAVGLGNSNGATGPIVGCSSREFCFSSALLGIMRKVKEPLAITFLNVETTWLDDKA